MQEDTTQRSAWRAGLLTGVLLAASVAAQATNTTLQAVKTIDICRESSTAWRYSGVISIWNPGVYDTVNFALSDCIQTRTGVNPFADVPALCTTTFTPLFTPTVPIVVPKAGAQGTALSFSYSVTGAPLAGDIRNAARPTITNYIGHAGSPYGIQVTATWPGGTPPSCNPSTGCTLTQGYWGNKPNVVWPAPYLRGASFYLSGQTWQVVLDTAPNASPGYYQLAHQYIAAVLNSAKGAGVPNGVQTTLDAAAAWLTVNGPAACSAKGSCGTQKNWASVLDLYNNGTYPGGPAHCGG